MVAIFTGSGSINPDPITCPTKVVLAWAKVHFFRLRVRPDSLTVCRNFFKCVMCSCHVIECTAMSPTKGSQKAFIGLRMSDIHRMNVLLADLRPKRRVNSNNPASHTKAVHGLYSGLTGSCQ